MAANTGNLSMFRQLRAGCGLTDRDADHTMQIDNGIAMR